MLKEGKGTTMGDISMKQMKIMQYEDHRKMVFVCSVCDFGAKGDGKSDDTEAFAAAVRYAESSKGGTVYVPRGRYNISKPLYIPRSVYLMGEWENPDIHPDQMHAASILQVLPSAQNKQGRYCIGIGPSAGIIGLTLYYTEQDFRNPVSYPPAIKVLDTEGGDTSGFATVRNVTLVNPCTGISCGPEWNELHVVEHVFMSPLQMGVFINMVTDIGRLEDIHISADYWARFDSRLSQEQLQAAMKARTIGMEMQRADWQYCMGACIRDVNTAFVFNRMKNSKDVTDGANAQFYDIHIQNVKTGFQLNYINTLGISVTKAAIETDGSPESVCLNFGEDYNGVLQLNGAVLKNEGGSCIRTETKAKGMMAIVDSVFQTPAGGTAIMLEGSSAAITHSVFEGAGYAVCLRDSSIALTLDKNRYDGEAAKGITDAANVYIGNQPYSEIGHYKMSPKTRPCPGPLGDCLMSVMEAGARPDEDADSTAPFQRAIDLVAQAGGGIVYVPGGTYRFRGGLMLRKGVELRGISESGHHSNGLGSVLYVYANQGNEATEPFIQMEEGSGIRGLTFWYPQQSQVRPVQYPWTIRGLGKYVYLVNVNIAGAYRGVDFGTYDCGGHYIRYLTGQTFKCNLWIDKSSETGYVKNCHFNPHFFFRVKNSGLEGSEAENRESSFFEFLHHLDQELEAFVFGSTTDEQIFDVFNYRGHTGMIVGRGGEFNGILFAVGLDGNVRGFDIENTGSQPLLLMNANTDLVPGETFYLRCNDKAKLHIVNSNFGSFNFTPHRGLICDGGEIDIIGLHFRASARGGAIEVCKGQVCAQALAFSHVGPILEQGFCDQRSDEIIDIANTGGEVTLLNSISRGFCNRIEAGHTGWVMNPYENSYEKVCKA